MDTRELFFCDEAMSKLLRGVDALANAVKVTLGPGGRCVAIEKKFGVPTLTKDGATVAKEITLTDNCENIGAQIVKEAASKTVDKAGDGTTTATVLAQELIHGAFKAVRAGYNPVEVKKGMDKAVDIVVKTIKSMAREVGNNQHEIEQVASISANNDNEIGKMIADAMQKVGKDGVITVEEAKGTQTEVKVVEGMEFDRGYLSRYFITNNENMNVELDDPYILMYDKKISSLNEILPILEAVVKTGKPLLIIADDVDGEALTTLVLNRVRAGLKVAAVKAPGFGDRKKEILEDIAVLTGGIVISEDKGHKLEDTKLTDLGHAEKVNITKDNTVIVNGKGHKDSISSRVQEIKYQIENSKSDYDKEKLRERLAKLSGGVAVMYVGASTEVEMKEKKDRIDDALSATRAAVEEGIVPGGGVALLRTLSALERIETSTDEEKLGVDIVKRAIDAPTKTILENVGEGFSAPVTINKIRDNDKCDFGYNARTKNYEEFYKSGVIDPAKVTRLAIQNAASVASSLMLSGCVVCYSKDKENAKDIGTGMDGGGMGMM